jgi:NAD(P)-dependent dehydrogenase (short-subunit alcohol dehydrogenase family)
MDSNNPISIDNKVILLTGALGQIGQSISRSFLAQGAKLIMADVNLEASRAFSAEMQAAGIPEDNFLIQELDITDEASCSHCVEKSVEAFGRIDVLINNAAIDAKFDKAGEGQINNSRFEYYPLDALRRSVEVNLVGTVLITQVVCRQMLKQGHGNIINVASTYSLVAPNQSLYDYGSGISQFKPVDYIASKSFIPNFTRYLATFYARNNIRCNALVPHGIYNNHPEPFLKNWERLSPMGRMCERDELNGPFTFLASDASSYMTGSVISVDGGWTAW